MRRLFAILLSIILVLCQVNALSEINLEEMSDDELLTLEASIVTEKIRRGIPASAYITAGVYSTGVQGDIPAGKYTIVFIESEQKSSLGDYEYLSVYVYDVDGELLNMFELTNEKEPNPSFTISFPEGGSIGLRYGKVRLIQFGGVVFQ